MAKVESFTITFTRNEDPTKNTVIDTVLDIKTVPLEVVIQVLRDTADEMEVACAEEEALYTRRN